MNGRYYAVNAKNLSNNIMEQKGKVFVYGKQEKKQILMSYRPELDVSPVFNPKESH